MKPSLFYFFLPKRWYLVYFKNLSIFSGVGYIYTDFWFGDDIYTINIPAAKAIKNMGNDIKRVNFIIYKIYILFYIYPLNKAYKTSF